MNRFFAVFIVAVGLGLPLLNFAQDIDSINYERSARDTIATHESAERVGLLLGDTTYVNGNISKRHQTNNKKEERSRQSYIGSTIGISTPLGSFAAKSGAAAKPGLYANLITIGYVLNSNWGIAFTSFVAINDYDEKSAPVYNNGELVGYKANIWTNTGTMLGFLYSYPISKDMHLDIRAMGGIAQMEVVEYGITHGMDWWGGDYSHRDEVTPACYSLGAILRYDFRRNFSILGSAEYFTCTPRLSDGFKSYDQPVRTYSIGIGIAYRLPF